MTPDLAAFSVSHASFLRQLERRNGFGVGSMEGEAYLTCSRAAETGKGVGWVVESLKAIAHREGRPAGFVRLDDHDDDHAHVQIADPHGLSPEQSAILAEGIGVRQRQLEMLGSDGALVLDALAEGTERLADRLGITQRRAQQLVDELVTTIKETRDNDAMMAALGRMASRIREADFLDGWEQGGLFGEAA